MKIRLFLILTALGCQSAFAALNLTPEEHATAATSGLNSHLIAGKLKLNGETVYGYAGQIEDQKTEQVPGWDQYRTSGKIAVQIVRKGGKTHKTTVIFEAVTEEKEGKAKLTSVRIRQSSLSQ